MNAIKTFFQRGDLLSIGFGMTVAMWATGYFFRLPALTLPSSLLFVALLLCLFIGGIIAGVYSDKGKSLAFKAGLLSALLNLMVLGSLLSDGPSSMAFLWIPALFIISGGIALLGAMAGNQVWGTSTHQINWTGSFAIVACVATFFLLIVGGLVTSQEAGLAVVDWPNSFGYNMFLYPLAHMTGGIYYEHAHRLFGSLVGLTTIFLAIHFAMTDNRTWLRNFLFACVVLVIIQGILGGLRVTGHFTLSTSEEVVKPNIYLAIAHGVLGQIFFASLISIAVVSSRRWLSDEKPLRSHSAGIDQPLTIILVVMLIVQLVYGALVRHISDGLMVHITLAMVVLTVIIASGARAWGIYTEKRILQRLGLSLIWLTVIQFVFGVLTLIALKHAERVQSLTVWDVSIATIHQANGAVILALAVMLMLWTCRLTEKPARTPIQTT